SALCLRGYRHAALSTAPTPSVSPDQSATHSGLGGREAACGRRDQARLGDRLAAGAKAPSLSAAKRAGPRPPGIWSPRPYPAYLTVVCLSGGAAPLPPAAQQRRSLA